MNQTEPGYDAVMASLATMRRVSLAELDRIQLLNRIDSKFIFHVKHLPALLADVSNDYPALCINEKTIFPYCNSYFDTDDFFLYHMHQRGMAGRFKVRIRTYADTGLSFFEVKVKTSSNRTSKTRVELAHADASVTDLLKHLPWGRHEPRPLHQVMNIDFRRVTLAGFHPPERITIDFDLCIRNAERELRFPDLVIAELKQDKSSGLSPFLHRLKKIHLEEIGFSKYAVSVALLEKVKYNAFKPVMIKLNRILHAENAVQAALLR
jgi:hypothetical protein